MNDIVRHRGPAVCGRADLGGGATKSGLGRRARQGIRPDQAAVRSAIDRVNRATSGDNPSAIRQALDNLQQAGRAMTEHLQAEPVGGGSRAESNGSSGASPNGGPQRGKEDDVIDVEFEQKA